MSMHLYLLIQGFNRSHFDRIGFLVVRSHHPYLLRGVLGWDLLIAKFNDIGSIHKRIRMRPFNAHLDTLIVGLVLHHRMFGAAHRIHDDAGKCLSIHCCQQAGENKT